MIKEYKEISVNILSLLNEENINDVKIKENFDKRQNIIDSLDEHEAKKFGKLYKSEKIYKLDEEIKIKLENKMLELKKDINEYKKNKVVNSAYININKKNLNLFSKKV